MDDVDRELDAAVAEEVFGLQPKLVDGGGEAVDYTDPLLGLPYYSTEIAAAMEVWEKMARLCGEFAGGDGYAYITFAEYADHNMGEEGCGLEPTHDHYSCHFHVRMMGQDNNPYGWDHGDRYCATAETLPVAICRAALKGVRRTDA